MTSPRPDTPPTARRLKGRPRQPDTDKAIHEAVRAVIREGGYAALSYERVARRAGVSRPTVYRRAPTKAALVVGALVDQYGVAPVPDTGAISGDLLALQQSQVRLYNDAVFCAALPGVLGDIRTDNAARQSWVEGFVKPRRNGVGAAIRRAVQRGELSATVDEEWVCEMLTGPILSTAFLTGPRPVPDDAARETVELVLRRFRPQAQLA